MRVIIYLIAVAAFAAALTNAGLASIEKRELALDAQYSAAGIINPNKGE